MLTTKVYKGLTQKEYQALKDAAKKELPFRVTMRYHKQKYCYGSIDIRTAKFRANGFHNTDEEIDAIIDFCKAHNIGAPMTYFDSDNRYAIYGGSGFNYLMNAL